MMKKLLVVYNPRSTHHAREKQEVLEKLRGLSGWMVGKYQIRPKSFGENVEQLTKFLTDGTLMIVAGGDGTAAMAMNAVMEAGKDVTVAVLGYGNFNDLAGMLGMQAGGVPAILEKYEQKDVKMLYPLEIRCDGEKWRYAMSYFTVGMLAQSTEVFERPTVREKLRTGRKGRNYSLWQLAKWYVGHHWGAKLPAGKYNGKTWKTNTTDYLAVNGTVVAGIMKGGEWHGEKRKFSSSVQRLGNIWRLVKFMLTSMRRGIPGEETESDVLDFAQPSQVEVHAEGEFERLQEVQKIEVKKAERGIKVIATGDAK